MNILSAKCNLFKTSKNKNFLAKTCNITKTGKNSAGVEWKTERKEEDKCSVSDLKNRRSTSRESALFEGVCAEIVQVEGCATRRAHREPGPLSTLIILALLSAHSLNRVCY